MTDFVWRPGVPGCRARTEPVDGAVWHWTAGLGDPEAVVRTLKARGLSIHYVIGKDGRRLQCADPATTVCYHAGSRANPRKVGIEICNPGLGSPTKTGRARVKGRAHGRVLDVLDFTPEQYAAIVLLADELSDRFDIPRITAPGDTVINVREFSGHLEHIMVSRRKIDCSTLVTTALRAHGYA